MRLRVPLRFSGLPVRFLGGLFALSLTGGHCVDAAPAEGATPASSTAMQAWPWKKASLPRRLLVGANHTFSAVELVTLASLQGQLARRSAEENIYLTDTDLPSGYGLWLELLTEKNGVTAAPLTSFDDTLAHFRPLLGSYVLYRADRPESLAVALILARATDAVVIEETKESAASAAGLKLAGDARKRELRSVTAEERAAAQPAPGLAVEQAAELPAQLRDYALFTGALTFPAANSSAAKDFMSRYPAGSVAMGWGDDRDDGERDFVGRNSRLGIPLIPANHVRNLSILSALPAGAPLRQKTTAPAVSRDEAPAAEHTVTFVFTDGDNLSWLLYDFPTDARWFGSPHRGRVPLGWGMAPALADLTPDVVRWYYNRASGGAAGQARDVFVAGPSGLGYFYPSLMPSAELVRHGARLDRLMQAADLRLVQVIDFDALDRTDVWDAYLSQPHIDGILYCDYAPYDKGQGRIVWARGKPVVSARAMLWKGVNGADIDSVAQKLNKASRDPRSAEGYSLVVVHAWTHSVADVVHLAEQLQPGVRVVAPDEFFQRIQGFVAR